MKGEAKTRTRHLAIRTVLVPEAAAVDSGGFVRLSDASLHHLTKVLRLEWGNPIRAVDGIGGVFEAELARDGAQGGVRLGKPQRRDPKPAAVELWIGLPKSSTMDWIVEKAVECGVTAIVPVVCSRSVVRPDPKESEKYVGRWQKIMDETAEQSERTWRAHVRTPVAWSLFGESSASGFASFAFVSELRESGDARKLFVECWKKLQAHGSAPMRLLVGPEGGFSVDEREVIRKAGFEELSLGETVLRVETAVVAALTLVRLSRTLSTT